MLMNGFKQLSLTENGENKNVPSLKLGTNVGAQITMRVNYFRKGIGLLNISAVVSTVASQQDGPEFNSRSGCSCGKFACSPCFFWVL